MFLTKAFPSRESSPLQLSLIGSLPVDSSTFVPLYAADPLHPDSLVGESLASQVQHLMALVQMLRGMAFALDPVTVHSFF